MSDTPRTDDVVMQAVAQGMRLAPVAEFCRELERENAELREARDQLTADFRAQAKQLTQCNRELAQQISQRKIREQLASAQKEATP